MKLLRYNKEPLVLSNVLHVQPISTGLLAVYVGTDMTTAERHFGYCIKYDD